MNGVTKFHICTHHGMLLSHGKGIHATCMGLEKKNYIKWNKPDTKGQMLYDSTFKNDSRKGKFTESRLEVSRDWGEGEKGKLLFKEVGSFCLAWWKVFEIVVGDGCTIVRMWFSPS